MTDIKAIVKDPILSGTIVVTVAVLIGSVFSYALQLYLSQNLTLAEFGTFNSLLSLSLIVGVFILVFTTSLIKLTAELKSRNEFGKLTSLFWQLSVLLFLLGIAISFLFFELRFILAKQLNINDPNLFTLFGIFLSVTLLATVPSAYLQGLLRFKAFAFSNVTTALLRFIFPVILTIVGFRLSGVFAGMIIGIFAAYFVSLFLLKKSFTKAKSEDLTPYFKQLILFSVPVFFVNVGMNMLNNIDVILVKKYFSEVDAGLYSGLVTLGKILLFGAGTVSAVMFPQISNLFANKSNYLSKLKMFVLLQLLTVFVGLLICIFFPQYLAMLFTDEFNSVVNYLPKFSIFIANYVLLNFIVLFLLAISRTKIFVIIIPGVIAQFLLINEYHANLDEVININILVSGFLLLATFLYTLVNARIDHRSGLQAGKNN